MPPSLESLGFYPLTVILSFSSQCDGTCLLLTKKSYTKGYLPMFRSKDDQQMSQKRRRKHRHRFSVSPVQGPVVLLQRLNTRRLAKREDFPKGLSTVVLANQEWQQSTSAFPHPPPLELLRFLDQIPKNTPNHPINTLSSSQGTTLLLSYPRSGNTLLRTLLERTTGIVTGSDTRPDRSLSRALAETYNLVGEGVTQRSKTCFVKTHWPERIGCRIFSAQRGVLLVRNPYDAIDSYWNLNATNTHTETVTDEIYQQFHTLFEGLVRNEIQVWSEFHRYWLNRQELDGFPLLIIRFEDLIQQPQVELRRILEFVADQPLSAQDEEYWNQRIQHATTGPSLGSYRPRTATTGAQSIGKSIRKGRYSPELLKELQSVDPELLQRFGYGPEEFPHNFVEGGQVPPLPSSSSSATGTTLRVNSGNYLVRPRDCPFGREMRNWRLQHTNNDQEPFPRIPR